MYWHRKTPTDYIVNRKKSIYRTVCLAWSCSGFLTLIKAKQNKTKPKVEISLMWLRRWWVIWKCWETENSFWKRHTYFKRFFEVNIYLFTDFLMSVQSLFFSMGLKIRLLSHLLRVSHTHKALFKSSSFIFWKVEWELKDTDTVLWAQDLNDAM